MATGIRDRKKGSLQKPCQKGSFRWRKSLESAILQMVSATALARERGPRNPKPIATIAFCDPIFHPLSLLLGRDPCGDRIAEGPRDNTRGFKRVFSGFQEVSQRPSRRRSSLSGALSPVAPIRVAP